MIANHASLTFGAGIMGVFWNGFFAGMIAIVLPSLTWFAVLVRNAPEIADGRLVR